MNSQANQQSREFPECLDYFHREKKSIIKVSMNKFHTMFVTTQAHVYACGYSHGGRLGLETENAVILPQKLKLSCLIVSVSAGLNHTLFLTDLGQVSILRSFQKIYSLFLIQSILI